MRATALTHNNAIFTVGKRRTQSGPAEKLCAPRKAMQLRVPGLFPSRGGPASAGTPGAPEPVISPRRPEYDGGAAQARRIAWPGAAVSRWLFAS